MNLHFQHRTVTTLWTCSQLKNNRRLGTRAASLSFPMPLSGGLNSIVSLGSSPASNSPPGLIQSSQASPSGKLTIDPRASGEDVTVVSFDCDLGVFLQDDMPQFLMEEDFSCPLQSSLNSQVLFIAPRSSNFKTVTWLGAKNAPDVNTAYGHGRRR